MRAAFYTGASGLVAYQDSMDAIGNNIANCNTVGYKAQRTAFSQLLSSEINKTRNPLVIGNGVRAVYTGIDPNEASVVASQGAADLALTGNGWFCVQNNNQKAYTRDGSFSISLVGSNAYLVNQNGDAVLDSSGQQISAPVDTKTNNVDIDLMLDKVGVFSFSNPEALTPASSNSYLANAYSGTAMVAPKNEYSILKGYLEQSSVSLADEMVALIKTQRGYQLSARVVQTADEVEQTINSLRR